MAAIRETAQMLKGSALMIFMNGEAIGFATEHNVEINVETLDVSTKDHGDYPGVLGQRITWTCSASNVYSEDGELKYANAMKSMQPVTVKFAKATEYTNYGAGATVGIVDVEDVTNWTPGPTIAEGKALITNLSMNAPAGDQATLSVQFTGVGELTFGTQQ